MPIAEHIVRVTQAGGDRIAIDFEGAVLQWSALGQAISRLDALLLASGLDHDSVIGLLGRNRLEQVGAFIGILGGHRAVLLVNSVRPSPLIAQEILDLHLPCILGSSADLSSDVLAAAKATGTLVVAVEVHNGALDFNVSARLGPGPFRTRVPGALIEIQTSGTTGKPKRIPVLERTVEASLKDGVRTAKGATEQQKLTPKSSPTLMFGPLVHTSGTFNTLMSVFEVRPIVLFEKFDAEKFRQALARYRPKFVPLPPTAMKMLVDSAATREEFSSVLAVRAGTSPLPVELQVAFEEKFGVPVLTTYGATEFMGVVSSWTLEDHRRFGSSKRGSVGRASQDVKLRIVDVSSGDELPSDMVGVLEAKVDRIDGGRNWIRTTDLARIDEDGFLYILGRTDDAINRGGFKVMAGKVADVLRLFPGVFDVIVVGQPDERLGEVPVAVIEPCSGCDVDVEALRAFAKERLTAYEVPTRIYVIERLPRTVSDKVSRPELKALLERLET